jgi:membrane-associated phospholipid phosphatase
MAGFWNWSTAIVLWLQTHLAGLTFLMQGLSLLGKPEFLLLLGVFLFWCVDVSIGKKAGLIFICSLSLGLILKLAFHMPRPYWYDAQVKPLAGEIDYGMPSIHSLLAMAFWPWLGRQSRLAWGWTAGLLLALGISLSRVYLGVHFPGDVVAGWAIGILVWFLVDWGIQRLGPVLKRFSLFLQCMLAVLASVLVIALQGLILAALAGIADPAAWARNAARFAAIAPRDPKDLISAAALILGLGAGLAFQNRWARFRADGPWGKRMLRFIVGVAGLLLIWVVIPELGNAQPFLIRMGWDYFKHALIGMWAVFLAPWAFLRLNLAGKSAE